MIPTISLSFCLRTLSRNCSWLQKCYLVRRLTTVPWLDRARFARCPNTCVGGGSNAIVSSIHLEEWICSYVWAGLALRLGVDEHHAATLIKSAQSSSRFSHGCSQDAHGQILEAFSISTLSFGLSQFIGPRTFYHDIKPCDLCSCDRWGSLGRIPTLVSLLEGIINFGV